MRKTKGFFLKKFAAYTVILAVTTTLLPDCMYHPAKAKAASHGLSNPIWNNESIPSDAISTWDCVYFGHYWQNDTNKDGTADRKDAKQAIKWRVLSVNGDDAFLLADQNLDGQDYGNGGYDEWYSCTMRSWLNGYGSSANGERIDYSSDSFIGNAFTSIENSAISKVKVVNENNGDNSGRGRDTEDKIFLLSFKEATNTKYGFLSNGCMFPGREAINTAYAKTCGTYTYTSGWDLGNGDWWLRSPGTYTGVCHVMYIDGCGYIDQDGEKYNKYGKGTRPVLHLNLNSSVWSYAGSVTSDGKTSKTSIANIVKTSRPKKVTGVRVSNAGKRKIVIKWNRVTNADGYQVQYAMNRAFTKKKKTVKVSKNSRKTYRKVKKNKTYYVRVRAYKKVNGKKKFGKWSVVKKVKTKK